ncbi:hypothetical protein NG798_00625 [Ancylothrix sp. C2]|uniref:hypothetical protein n=1 Tax=Ancylothrix sp. D3o TaxID=2953691 RepID=UPI0021BA4F65|nr:hypothetical protein [Ancylothrix sp. D3o]MCT7948297.1 hypothetical protein [Ancylothrix sp. D3o]
MDCREKFPGQILLTPLFPDGRGELIDILLPGLECEVKSYFLPEDLDLRGIKRNRNPVECIKPQKSKSIGDDSPSSETNDDPIPPEPLIPNIPPDTIGLWLFAGFYSYSGFVAAPPMNIVGPYTKKTTKSFSRSFTDGNNLVVVITANGYDGYWPGIGLPNVAHRSRSHYFFVLDENLNLIERSDTPRRNNRYSTVYETGVEIEPFFHQFQFFYGSWDDAASVITDSYSFRRHPMADEGFVETSTFYQQLVWGSAIDNGGDSIIQDGDNGMKEDCCDCIEAMAALMEAYMEKVEKLIKESEARIKEHINDTAYRQCVFFQEQLKAFDIKDDDRVIERIDRLENNIWTGGELTPLNINSENK